MTMQPRPVRLGILGASWIAPIAVIEPAENIPKDDLEVVAIAARDSKRAVEFAQKHRLPKVYKTYDDLLEDPDIDAVYISLPNSHHLEWTLKCLKARKHVLVEKPLACNEEEAKTMADAAEKSGLIVMEAFHYRYHPMFSRVLDIARNELGQDELESRDVQVTFCIPIFNGKDIRYDYNLGGGALMDTGCYAINCARQLLKARKTPSPPAAIPSSSVSEAKLVASYEHMEQKRRRERSVSEHKAVTEPENIEVLSATAKLAYPNIDQDVTAVLQRKRTVTLPPLSFTSGGPPLEKTVIDTATVTCSIFTIVPSVSLVVRQGDKELRATGWVAPHVIYNSIVLENTVTHLERSESFPLPTYRSKFSLLGLISTVSNAISGHDSHDDLVSASASSFLPSPPPAASTYEHQLRAFVTAIKTNDPSVVITSARDGQMNMKIIDDIYRKLGLPVRGTKLNS
eukprot:TRINITY_DN694_c0_g5_i1.p1 TRINITY_DN694_c0_g5~~TRINITY_DN694_c0_g5_i1.p1  ORF type:complete len:456 (-),score=108.36 TRINITY_DN694_c0_g5_i1:113-1480(-)